MSTKVPVLLIHFSLISGLLEYNPSTKDLKILMNKVADTPLSFTDAVVLDFFPSSLF